MARKILLVDDEPDILQVIILRLKKAGYDVIIARNGEEAISCARSTKPDLILMDYKMPVMDGLDACRHLKTESTTAGIPIIFMSASSAAINLDIVKAAKGDDYISKPFDIADLLKRIENFLKG